MSVPFSQFILKVHSRCDLACDHCYMYQGPDQSWRGRPMQMGRDTVRAVGRRIAEHAVRHDLDAVEIVLHGGEPLLCGVDGLREICDGLHAALAGSAKIAFSVQTNGVLLNAAFCELFLEYGIRVGVSLDGGRVANDRHRRFAHGGGSYDHAVRGINLLRMPTYRQAYAGLLCTVDVENDPIEVFEDLAALEPPVIDVLLPHATWEQPPPGGVPGGAVYGDWLVTLFDHWYAEPKVRVRLLDELVVLLLGGASRSESIGLSPAASVVIETDGAIEQTDTLKIAFHGAGRTGTNVFDDPLDVALTHPAIAARQAGLAGLCDTCRSCPVVSACGGGLYAHRYRRGGGWDNPSVYCEDLTRLITHVRTRIDTDLSLLREPAR